jgi:hypothetical protein
MFDNKKQAVMKKYTFIKVKPLAAVTLLALFLSSCGSSQYVSSSSDGIYGEDLSRNYTVIEETQKTPETSSIYYNNYFKEKGLEVEQVIDNEEVFTDVDSYSSNTDTDVSNNSGWGEQPSNVTVNVYNSGWNNWGWNNWGWNNWGWNNWGWNTAYYSGFGWNNWGWYGGFYNGWNNPYYGYGYYGNGYYNYDRYRRGYTYNNRRASYRGNYLDRYTNNRRSGLNGSKARPSRYKTTNTSRPRSNANTPRSSQPRTKPRAVRPTRSSPRATSPRTTRPRASSPRSSSPRSYSSSRSGSSSRGSSRSSSRRPR